VSSLPDSFLTVFLQALLYFPLSSVQSLSLQFDSSKTLKEASVCCFAGGKRST
jgi:hypothetical protein